MLHNGINIDVSEIDKVGPELLYLHRVEIDGYIKVGSKLAAVKAIKEYSGLGLRDVKHLIELYIDGKIIPRSNVVELRRKKLEKLTKTPLVDELIKSIKKLDDDKIHSLLMNLTIDDLFNIDELINK